MVLIAMILTIVAVNSYSGMKQRRSLRSSAESVRDVLTNARSMAVSRNAWHRVVFQLKDPATGLEKVGYWIDEIDPGTSVVANTNTLEPATRALVVPWQDFPDSVQLVDANIKGTTYTLHTQNGGPEDANNYWVIRFMPNGSSDDANIRLKETSIATATGPEFSEVRLFSATAKAKIVAARP